MRLSALFALAAALAAAACVRPPPAPKPAPVAAVMRPSGPSQAAIAAEVTRLRLELAADVPQPVAMTPVGAVHWFALARQSLATAHVTLRRAQLLVVVDRNPAVQRLAVVLGNPFGPWQLIGTSKVSTGQAGRHGYFITPTGVFIHNGDILDYRALGTFNENHIRGLGLKGMRVWDFGWQEARRGWGTEDETGEIRLLMHATDPDYLAQRLGRPASKGCIRIPAGMNRFLDVYGVLDREYEREARDDPRYEAVLLPDRHPTFLAGDKLVVVDSGAG